MKEFKNMFIIQGLHDGLMLSDSLTGENLTGLKVDYNEALKLAIRHDIKEVAFIDHDLVGHMIEVKSGVVTTYGKLSFKQNKLDNGIYSPKQNISIILA